MNATIRWTKTATGATGIGHTRHHTYRFTIKPSEFFQWITLSGVITITATGEVVSEGHLGSAATVAQCKASAKWHMETGGPRLDARVDEVAR